MSRIEVSDADWPIVTVTYPREHDQAEEEALYAQLMQHLLRREVFGLLIDARAGEIPAAAERARMADFLRETNDLSARYVAAMGLVMLTAGGRGVLTALLWLFSPPFPTQAFATITDARSWVLQRVREKPRTTTRPPPFMR